MVTIESVSFRSGARQIVASVFLADGPRAVLFIHGAGSSQQPYWARAKTITEELAAICLTFDLSGHGRDAANVSLYSATEHVEDVTAAFDYLLSIKGVDKQRVGVCGASYGGYLAALLTARRPQIACLVLRAPSLFEGIDPRLPISASPALNSIAAYSGPTLIVESENDRVIPKSYIDAYLEACQKPEHALIPKAEHALTTRESNETFVSLLIDWFGRL